jgi:hypothetical protein
MQPLVNPRRPWSPVGNGSSGPLYQNDKTGSVWAEVGAAAMTGPLDPGVSDGELDSARRLGERVARLALKLKRAETQVHEKR